MIDKTIVAQARATDMIVFLEQRHGFTFAHRGGVYRCRQHQSLAVKDDRLSWYWHSKGVGGHGVIDFLMKMEALPFRQAVETVAHLPIAAPISREPRQDRPLVLPEKAGLLQARLLDYLCNHRGIGSGIVTAMLDEGRIYEDRRGHIVNYKAAIVHPPDAGHKGSEGADYGHEAGDDYGSGPVFFIKTLGFIQIFFLKKTAVLFEGLGADKMSNPIIGGIPQYGCGGQKQKQINRVKRIIG